MNADELTDFERAVFDKMLAGEHPVLIALREQLRTIRRIKRREFSGCGFFTELEVDRTVAAAPTNRERLQISDVGASIPGLEHGAGFVLFVNGGYLDFLEGFSYDEPWPVAITDFSLMYIRGAGGFRNLAALQIDLS